MYKIRILDIKKSARNTNVNKQQLDMQTNCFIMILYIHVSSCKMDIWSGTTYKMPIPRIIIEEQFVVHSTSPEFGDMTILLSIDWNDQEKFRKTVRKTNWLQPYKLLIQILLPGITQINRVDALLFYSLFYSKHIQPILSPFFVNWQPPKHLTKSNIRQIWKMDSM